MKEAKSVCPLESIVTTAITQVIWPKLRHPPGFSMPSLQGNRNWKEWLTRKQSALATLPARGHQYGGGDCGTNFSFLWTPQEAEASMPLAYSKCLYVFSVRMLPPAGVGDPQGKWEAMAAYLLVFLNKVHPVGTFPIVSVTTGRQNHWGLRSADSHKPDHRAWVRYILEPWISPSVQWRGWTTGFLTLQVLIHWGFCPTLLPKEQRLCLKTNFFLKDRGDHISIRASGLMWNIS